MYTLTLVKTIYNYGNDKLAVNNITTENTDISPTFNFFCWIYANSQKHVDTASNSGNQ